MSIVENIKTAIQNHFEKQKEEKEHFQRLQKEIAFHKRQVFEEEYRKNALEVAKAQAKKEASEKSGLQKLRAQNRLRNLNSNEQKPDSFFSKLSTHVRNNQARTAERLKRTEEMRSLAKENREKQLEKRRLGVPSNINKPKWR